MPFGASYNQVAESGIIHVDDLAENLATSPAVQREFHEELINLARNMAKVKIEDREELNKPLLAELIKAFRTVDCAVLTTQDQFSSRNAPGENLVFLLCNPGDPPDATPIVAKPHKGKLVLASDSEGNLFIPIPVSHLGKSLTPIPFPLTAQNIETIPGPIGKNLSEAYHLGVKDITRHKTAKPRIQREEAQERLAREEIAEQLHGNPKLHRYDI